MIILTPLALPILALSAQSAASDTLDTRYSASLEIIENNGTVETTTVVKLPFALADGNISSANGVEEAAPLLSGDLQIDPNTNLVRSNFTLCRPARTACETIAQPSLNFAMGDEGRFHISGPNFSATLILAPAAS